MERLLIIISSPSGGGKTTICKKLVSDSSSPIFGKVKFSVSATTRKIRGNEIDGRDYHFFTKEQFEEKIKNDEFLEYANVFGNYYGTLKSEISPEKHIIFDIDVAGHKQIKSKTEVLSIFLLPPSLEILKERVSLRGDISSEEIEKRISIAPSEILQAHNYEYILINETIESTFRSVCTIISSALLKKNHQKLVSVKDFTIFFKNL